MCPFLVPTPGQDSGILRFPPLAHPGPHLLSYRWCGSHIPIGLSPGLFTGALDLLTGPQISSCQVILCLFKGQNKCCFELSLAVLFLSELLGSSSMTNYYYLNISQCTSPEHPVSCIICNWQGLMRSKISFGISFVQSKCSWEGWIGGNDSTPGVRQGLEVFIFFFNQSGPKESPIH